MHRQDLFAALLVRPIDQRLTVKTPGTKQCRIEDLRPVGGGKKHQAARGIETVELAQELV